MAWSITTQPTDEPVSLEEVKQHLRIVPDDENALFLSLARAAREYAELFTGRQLMTATYQWDLDGFPVDGCPLELPRPPLQSITSITYIDTAGVSQTWSSILYTVDTKTEPGRIYPVYGQTYPTPRTIQNAVRVTFVAGYTSAILVPYPIKQAILMLIGNWYENREATVVGIGATEIPLAVESLLWSKRILLAA